MDKLLLTAKLQKQGRGNVRDEQEEDGRETSPKRQPLNEERWAIK